MIIKEYYRTREDGVNLYRTYSDANFKIQKVGTNEVYDEAIDVQNAPYTYEETTEPIEPIEIEGGTE
jgi:hypothetical protein